VSLPLFSLSLFFTLLLPPFLLPRLSISLVRDKIIAMVVTTFDVITQTGGSMDWLYCIISTARMRSKMLPMHTL
jgi:hypothetical protein